MVRTDDGIELHVVHEGSGQPLVLCHGGPGLWDYLDDLSGLLQPFAHIWRYDQRGCGRSGGTGGPYTIERFVRDLEAIRSATGHQRIVVGGHSWGATLALLYAATHPERILGVLYVCGTGIEWPRWKGQYRAERTRRLAGSGLAALSETSSPEARRERRVLGWSADYADRETEIRRARAMASAGFEVNESCNAALNAEVDAIERRVWQERCGRVEAPVLVVQGARDPRPLGSVDTMLEALPDAERLVLPGAHYPWVEAPRDLEQGVGTWLATVRQRGSLWASGAGGNSDHFMS